MKPETVEAVERLKLLANGCDVAGLDHLPVVSRENAAPFATDLRTVLAALEASSAQSGVEGWKLVPCEPTEEMLFCADLGEPIGIVLDDDEADAFYAKSYRAMLAAAPLPPSAPPKEHVRSSAAEQLIDQARGYLARTWTEQGWRAEQSLDHPGYWDVWTLDSSGQRRIMIARWCTQNTAALLCFVSTGMVQLCDLADAALSAPPKPAPAEVVEAYRLIEEAKTGLHQERLELAAKTLEAFLNDPRNNRARDIRDAAAFIEQLSTALANASEAAPVKEGK